SSSPVRILRDESGQSVNTKGLYPMGEGPGYGGGIMSCALDGIRTADRILRSLMNSSKVHIR
ncbi:MAG: FAD-dependent oxidoreductase, partial [Erysipelotrichaceae bacterium]|nr:FAD-dependent oxidoreductase [Erysipelotrichaceae bacterium]